MHARKQFYVKGFFHSIASNFQILAVRQRACGDAFSSNNKKNRMNPNIQPIRDSSDYGKQPDPIILEDPSAGIQPPIPARPSGIHRPIQGGLIGSADIPCTSTNGTHPTIVDQIVYALVPVVFAAVMMVTIHLVLAQG